MSAPVFHPITSTSGLLNEVYTKQLLRKWDMSPGKTLSFSAYRYIKFYHRTQAQEFVLDLLNDPQCDLKVLTKAGEWERISEPVTKVDVEIVPCSLIRMDLFDKLLAPSSGIVRERTGDIIRCMDDQREGFQISDRLREMLLAEESEHYELYSDEEKLQLLWRLFEHLCLGGSCCQFEDKIDVYLETTKKLYKELLTVQKSSSGAIEVASVVYKVKRIETQSGKINLFPSTSRNNFLYVSVDPLKRVAKVLYNGFIPVW
jgi:hypothetical protein